MVHFFRNNKISILKSPEKLITRKQLPTKKRAKQRTDYTSFHGSFITTFLAGLLTYFIFEILPVKKNSGCYFQKILVWSLQQRVCSGFSPDSLLSAFSSTPAPAKVKKILVQRQPKFRFILSDEHAKELFLVLMIDLRLKKI